MMIPGMMTTTRKCRSTSSSSSSGNRDLAVVCLELASIRADAWWKKEEEVALSVFGGQHDHPYSQQQVPFWLRDMMPFF